MVPEKIDVKKDLKVVSSDGATFSSVIPDAAARRSGIQSHAERAQLDFGFMRFARVPE